MSLIFMDGFQSGVYASKWTATAGALSVAAATPRIAGGSYLSFTNSAALTRKSFTAAGEVFLGFGARQTAGDRGWMIALRGDSNVTTHLTVMLNASGLIEVRRGTTGGTLLATGATAIGTGWRYVEVRATVHDSTGVVQVRLDGSTSNEIDFVGDTKNAGTASTLDAVEFGRNVNNYDLADLYILNTSGAANTTWRGDVKVITRKPNGNGTTSGLTGSDGNQVNNFEQVDETTAATADYNGAAAGAKDTYALEDLPAGVTTIHAVQVNAHWAKSDAGTSSGKVVVRSGGTDYADTAQALSTTYTTYSKVYETDPATSAAWGASGVNALEAGMEAA